MRLPAPATHQTACKLIEALHFISVPASESPAGDSFPLAQRRIDVVGVGDAALVGRG